MAPGHVVIVLPSPSNVKCLHHVLEESRNRNERTTAIAIDNVVDEDEVRQLKICSPSASSANFLLLTSKGRSGSRLKNRQLKLKENRLQELLKVQLEPYRQWKWMQLTILIQRRTHCKQLQSMESVVRGEFQRLLVLTGKISVPGIVVTSNDSGTIL